MPIKKSAIKRAKQNIVRRDKNRGLKKTFRLNVKNLLKTLKTEGAEKAATMVAETQKSLDKAAKNNAIHKNTAARRKSRLMKKLNAGVEVKAEVKKAAPKKKPAAKK